MYASLLYETQNLETIMDFIRFAVSQARRAALYYGHGTDNAWDDMHALVLGSLSLPQDIYPAFLQARVTLKEKKHLCQQLAKRIEEHIPVPYLTQEAFFCDLSFYVDARVLIPRSPVAELIRQQFSPWVQDEVASILDLCTGSGCIAIACAYAFPEAQVHAVDISAEALEVADINCSRHHLEDRLSLILSDCFEKVPAHQYDVIISNPPYVSEEEMQTLPKEYTHEPTLALHAPNQGLAVVDKILAEAARYLTKNGILIVEVGNSEMALMEAYPHLPFTWLEFENGGQGVFLLTRDQLIEVSEHV